MSSGLKMHFVSEDVFLTACVQETAIDLNPTALEVTIIN